eukprot:m.148716 g.148716  ORF g.148716 m.148716 type:complete len:944 (+) comp15003_c0_seq4:44-2875(+)
MVALVLLCVANLAFGNIPPYFQRLQTQQVNSTPFVRWTDFGPGMAGYSDKFFVHPTDPNTMFVTMDMGNGYYTHDNGLSWHTTKNWDTDAENNGIIAIDFSRQNPNFGLAIGDHGVLMVTSNRGTSFTVLNGSAPAPAATSVITVDPQNDKNWYVGSGQFWRVKNVHRSIANITGTRTPGTDYGHIFVSKDGGKSWTTISIDPLLDVGKIFVDPNDSNIVYAFTNIGFLKSTNGGYGWNKTGQGLPFNQPRDGDFFYNSSTGEFILYLVEQTHYFPNDNNTKTVKSLGGAYKSLDQGETWISISGNIAIDMTQIHQDLAVECYYKCLGYWFNVTANEAMKKYPDMPTSIYPVFNRIVASKTNKSLIFLGYNIKHDYSFGPGEIWRTVDGGLSWTAVGRNGIYWVNETDKAYWLSRNNPLGMNMKYAHLDFEMRTIDMDAGLRMLIAKPDGDLIAIHEQQTLRSMDDGETWTQIDDDETSPGSGSWVGRGGSNLPGITMLMQTGREEYLFASGEHGLWRSVDGGDSVIKYGVAVEQLTGESKTVFGATSICSVAVHPTNPDIMFIQMFRQSYRGEIRKSTDGGATWTNISYPIQSQSALSPNIIRQKDLTISNADPSIMYFTVPYTDYCPFTPTQWIVNGPDDFQDFGVYRSKDGGFTWQWLNNRGLPANGSVARICMDPHNSSILYAAMNRVNIQLKPPIPGGLFQTVDGGDNWISVPIPQEIVGVNHISIDTDGVLYIAAGEFQGEPDGGGVWRKSKGTWEKIFFMPNVFECYPSPVNPNVLVASVGMGKKISNLNPGIYFSKDSGNTWIKANYEIDQPARIMAMRPDQRNENIIWIALYGSGWMKGILSNVTVRAIASNVYIRSGEMGQLDASESIGQDLSFSWSGAGTNPVLSSTSDPNPTFTAPKITSVEQEYKYNLTVKNSAQETDTIEVRVVVRRIL